MMNERVTNLTVLGSTGSIGKSTLDVVARHPQRPHALDYIAGLITDFVPLAGDRKFGEDQAIVGGFGRFQGESICVLGQEKGADTESRLKHNFGMAMPEGYRKAIRLAHHAGKFGFPIISLIDTPGAYPGAGAEERGIAAAIAQAIMEWFRVPVPMVAAVKIIAGDQRQTRAGFRYRVMDHARKRCRAIWLHWRLVHGSNDREEPLRAAAPKQRSEAPCPAFCLEAS